MKTCTKCLEIKPLSEFYKNQKYSDGRTSACKACERESARGRATRNRESNRLNSKRWRDANPDRVQALNRAYYEKNKSQVNEQNKRWYRENRQKALAQMKEWRKANPDKIKEYWIQRRARKHDAEGSHTEQEWQDLLKIYPQCLNPDCPDPSQPPTRDHVIALINGGSDYITNIQPLCASCNSSKGTKTVDYRPPTS